MHDLALSQSIVDLVLERAAAERLRTETRVVVEVGAAAGVDPESLRFCFEAVTEETAARGAERVCATRPFVGRRMLERAHGANCDLDPAGRRRHRCGRDDRH
jgi:hydrogenase nickel incorporation protein HypA/HybF